MKKDFYLETLELLISDYMDEHPEVTWDEAYKAIVDRVYDVALDRMADMADYYRDMQEDR
jgi:hypothetical protein